jgi:hypothetical protein
MKNNFEKPLEESGAAFAVAIVLLNVLTLAAAGGLIWLLQMLITLNSPFSAAWREIALR